MQTLLKTLKADFPSLRFVSGEVFSWSPKDHTITLGKSDESDERAIWSLLHEMGHALLEHKSYRSDLELVQLEAAAWDKAVQLGETYKHQIDPDHIQDCLDTYRDWLHQRSTCPTCQTISLQRDIKTYCCYNCNTTWAVSRTRLCRPYRRLEVRN